MEELDTNFHRFYSEVHCKEIHVNQENHMANPYFLVSDISQVQCIFWISPRSTGVKMMKFGIWSMTNQCQQTGWPDEKQATSSPTTVSGPTQPPKSKLSALPAPAQLP